MEKRNSDYEILVVDDASPDESIVERNEMIELLPELHAFAPCRKRR